MTANDGFGDDNNAREGFFSEAEDLVLALDRSLVELDVLVRSGDRGGGAEAELVNEVFRAAHTLKGISSLFAVTLMATVSHELEDLLDDLRLGRVALTTAILDVLFDSLAIYTSILTSARRRTPEPTSEARAFLEKLRQVVPSRSVALSAFAKFHLPQHVLELLTQYEEYRLKANIEDGASLFWLRADLLLATIDSALEELKTCTRPVGETIAYLPAATGHDSERVALEILLASHFELTAIQDATAAMGGVTVDVVERRAAAATDETKNEKPIEDKEKDTDKKTNDPIQTGGLVPVPLPHPSPPRVDSEEENERKKSAVRTVRVDIRKLDDLLGVVGELATVRGILSKLEARTRADPNMRMLSPDLERLRRVFDRSVVQVQNHVLDVRMVPLSHAFDRLARIVRQAAREQDKDVHLVVTGADTEIDKLLVEELSDPLMHVIRNAVDHGIEDRETRMGANKPRIGTIALNAYQKGNHVVIDIEDDGRGIDPALIAKTARERGIADEAEIRGMSAKELIALVFKPGFTTRTQASALSGRGVGMDVVKTNIGKIGGVVEISSSDIGIGTRIAITLPITLAIMSALVVEVYGRVYCMPIASVEEAIAFDETQVRRIELENRKDRTVITHRDATLPIARLADVFELSEEVDRAKPPASEARLVVAKVADRRVGFVVERLLGREDIVVKALGRSLKNVRGLVGAAELGDQRLGLVLDAASLIEETLDSNT